MTIKRTIKRTVRLRTFFYTFDFVLNTLKMKYFSVKETAEILGITERAVQKRCKQKKVWKKDNIYQIDAKLIDTWSAEIRKANEPTNERFANGSFEAEKNELLKLNEERLKMLHEMKMENITYRKENESLKAKIVELETELQQYEIAENERIEVFTNENYILFETRLKEWHTQRQEIEHQEQIFNAEKKSLNELYEHYKNQFEYQRNQNEKVLEMHQKLLDIISSQSKSIQERNLIEAVEKNIVKNDTWKPK